MSKTNVYQLPMEQLQGLKEQLDNDLRSLGAAYDGLQNGRGRYLDSCDAVEQYQQLCKRVNDTTATTTTATMDDATTPVADAAASSELLVCMTSSLFVRGRVVPSNKVLVDVGTGYFLEQPTERATTYFTSRAAQIKESMDAVEKTIVLKQQQQNQVIDAMQRRAAQLQQQQQQQPSSSS